MTTMLSYCTTTNSFRSKLPVVSGILHYNKFIKLIYSFYILDLYALNLFDYVSLVCTTHFGLFIYGN